MPLTPPEETKSIGLQPLEPEGQKKAPPGTMQAASQQPAITTADVIGEIQKTTPQQTGVGTPGFQQFVQPYEKYIGDLWGGFQSKMQSQLTDAADELSRTLYGQNIAPGAGLGTEQISRFMEEQTAQLAPYAQELTGQTGLQAIGDYMQQLQAAGMTGLGTPTFEAEQFDYAKAQNVYDRVISGELPQTALSPEIMETLGIADDYEGPSGGLTIVPAKVQERITYAENLGGRYDQSTNGYFITDSAGVEHRVTRSQLAKIDEAGGHDAWVKAGKQNPQLVQDFHNQNAIYAANNGVRYEEGEGMVGSFYATDSDGVEHAVTHAEVGQITEAGGYDAWVQAMGPMTAANETTFASIESDGLANRTDILNILYDPTNDTPDKRKSAVKKLLMDNAHKVALEQKGGRREKTHKALLANIAAYLNAMTFEGGNL